MRVATQVNLTKKLIKEKRNHTNTHKQTTKSNPSGVLNARVHYTVLTQHPNHTPPTRTVSTRIMVRHTKKGIMPQTPNNAPTYKQLTSHVHGTRITKRHSNTWSCLIRVCVPPGQFSLNKKVGSMTLAHSTNQRVQLHPQNKAP